MGSAGDLSQTRVKHKDTHVLQCLLCHRARLMYREHQGATEWESMTEFLSHYWLRNPDFVGIDTYCDECTVYYRQLMTYGQSAHGQTRDASIDATPCSGQTSHPIGLDEACPPLRVTPLSSTTTG